LISMVRPLTQILAIGTYIPIQHLGYAYVYKFVFCFNLLFSVATFFFADATSTTFVMTYILLYPVVTGAIQSAGFHLAMSDMVTELKRDRLLARRFGEPSMAGMFMGFNALMCKPMESLLPMVAGTVMNRHGTDEARIFFYLLVLPPAFFSILQLVSWSWYDLTPKRTAHMRQELKELIGAREEQSGLLL
jgi:Na+/melibiose symporter-like transporter